MELQAKKEMELQEKVAKYDRERKERLEREKVEDEKWRQQKLKEWEEEERRKKKKEEEERRKKKKEERKKKKEEEEERITMKDLVGNNEPGAGPSTGDMAETSFIIDIQEIVDTIDNENLKKRLENVLLELDDPEPQEKLRKGLDQSIQQNALVDKLDDIK